MLALSGPKYKRRLVEWIRDVPWSASSAERERFHLHLVEPTSALGMVVRS